MREIQLIFASDDTQDRFVGEFRFKDTNSLIAEIEKVGSDKFVLSTSGSIAEVDAEVFVRLLHNAIEDLRHTIE